MFKKAQNSNVKTNNQKLSDIRKELTKVKNLVWFTIAFVIIMSTLIVTIIL